jgi:hypothetical protein
MTLYEDPLLDLLELRLEERRELEARRAAAHRHLVLECCPLPPARWPQGLHASLAEIHLIEPRLWLCIAVRRSWANMHRLVEDCRPVVIRRLVDQAAPCPAHPTQSI